MEEQHLLFQVLDDGVPIEDIKTWLDDAFEATTRSEVNAKHLKFKQYDPMSFVVVILNFLREDTAPLLAPSFDRSVDHPSPAPKAGGGSVPGVISNDGGQQTPQRGLFATKTFDISSKDDFPSLPLGEVPRGNRAGNKQKQKRRIRPTPLTEADKPSEGLLPQALKTAETPSTAFEDLVKVDSKIVSDTRSNVAERTDPSVGVKIEYDETEEGFGIGGGIAHLREATSGSMPESRRLVQRSSLAQESEGIALARSAGNATPEARCSRFKGDASADRLLHTPIKTQPAPGGSSDHGVFCGSGCASPAITPTPFPTTSEKEHRRRREQPLIILASLYVHVMIRRFVPSLATEMHLTIRLLHVHSEVARSSSETTMTLAQDLRENPFSSSRSVEVSPLATETSLDEIDKPNAKVVFRTGLDCRSFAANVLLGLKCLLPHIGTDTLDLLAGSLALASQSEELIGEVRQVLCEAKGDGVKIDGISLRNGGQQNADDTAIVQSVGAPFAALQWREEDSLKNFRTTSDRSMFQNRQESVDRFGSLLRDYQGSKKGLQQYPERALQDLRTAACALISGLAPENYPWLAQYFLGQLVGWGLALPEETDSEVMALVAPAGDKGREALQKLHRRISTPSFGEDGNALKSSQKLRHPGAKAGVQRPRPRKNSSSSNGPRHSKGHTPAIGVRVPTAPLQLQWFPGNQEFFYHVLLVLDSHTFNSHMKAELAAEIARLYQQQTAFKTRREGVGFVKDGDEQGSRGSAAASEGVRGFTGIMVKLKVLAKFLGLLTFSSNWGVSASDPSPTASELPRVHGKEQVYTTNCPLPLDAYLDHAWSTAGLVGAVPWLADFLRMMKWDEISAQAGFYRQFLRKLAKLHAEPCMRPGHPAFTESLLVVSCEVESLFQDLGSDLGVQGYRTAVDVVVSSAGHGAPAQVPALSARMCSKPPPGSLDDEVVLSRRLIQNCCPYLEDVLALIRSLGRAWKLGLVAGGNGTPFRLGQSPRVVGVSGISPRSRRVIKPHPMKPIRVLPSLPEQHQRGDSSSETTIGTGGGGAHAENARLRLVQAFFHSLPDELQDTADFVARRAVQNACEEVLAEVIRPAVVTAVNQLDTACIDVGSVDRASRASSSLMAQFSGGATNTVGEGLIRKRVDQVMVAVGKTLQFEARALAGKRGNAIAASTTLSLAPLSLSLRVRQMASTIAGHHAQQAAERKIGELTTATVSEVVSSFHIQHASTQPIAVQKHSKGKDVNALSRDPLISMVPASEYAAALVGYAHNLGVKFNKERLLDAVHLVYASKASDIQAIKTVVGETLQLAKEIRLHWDSRGMPSNSVIAEEGAGDAGHFDGNKEEVERNCTRSSFSAIVGTFLSSLALLYGTLPDCHHRAWQGLRDTSTSSVTFGNAVEDLVHLAAIALERDDVWSLESVSVFPDATENLSGYHGSFSDKNELAPGSVRFSPWEPIIQVMSWGAIPILTAENSLLSCIQAPANLEAGDKGCCGEKRDSRRDILMAVVTSVTKRYHSLGVGDDLSTVLLGDLLGVAASSLVRLSDAANLVHYHPMNLCRLVARLTILHKRHQ